MPGLDQPPRDPYVRQARENGVWHLAVRVLPLGQVVIRCRAVPLAPPLAWCGAPPDLPHDDAGTVCPRCVSAEALA